MKAKRSAFSIKFVTALLLLSTGILIPACKKTAGEGGSSSIKGTVIVEDWNKSFTVKNGEYPGADEEVYIVYGDNIAYGERQRANNKGEFEFKYLRKGKYKIYIYSEDNTMQSVSGMISVEKQTEISKNKQTITLEPIRIFK